MRSRADRLRLISKQIGQCAGVRHCRERFGFRRVAQAVFKFVKRADMVDMRMRRDGYHRLAGLDVQESAKGFQTHAEVDDEIGIPSNYMKKVGAEKGMHIWLPNPKDPIGNTFRDEPVRLVAQITPVQ